MSKIIFSPDKLQFINEIFDKSEEKNMENHLNLWHI